MVLFSWRLDAESEGGWLDGFPSFFTASSFRPRVTFLFPPRKNSGARLFFLLTPFPTVQRFFTLRSDTVRPRRPNRGVFGIALMSLPSNTPRSEIPRSIPRPVNVIPPAQTVPFPFLSGALKLPKNALRSRCSSLGFFSPLEKNYRSTAWAAGLWVPLPNIRSLYVT